MAFSNKRKVVISKGDSFKKKETEIKSLLRKNEGEDDPENIFSHQVMQRHGKRGTDSTGLKYSFPLVI